MTRRSNPLQGLLDEVAGNPRAQEIIERTRIASSLGELAYRMRSAAELTQGEVATAVGTRQSVISRLEGGNGGHVPSMPQMERIAAACGFSMTVGANPIAAQKMDQQALEVQIPAPPSFGLDESES